MASAPAVATIGAAELFVLFVAKRDAAVAAIACGNVDKGFVYKFHAESLQSLEIKTKKQKAPTGRGFDGASK